LLKAGDDASVAQHDLETPRFDPALCLLPDEFAGREDFGKSFHRTPARTAGVGRAEFRAFCRCPISRFRGRIPAWHSPAASDVLWELNDAPNRELRMHDLARRILMSASVIRASRAGV